MVGGGGGTVLKEMTGKGGFVELGRNLRQGKLPQVYKIDPS